MVRRDAEPDVPELDKMEITFVRLATMKHGGSSLAEEASVKIWTAPDEITGKPEVAGELTAVFLDARNGPKDYYGSFLENYEEPPYLATYGFENALDDETHLLLINDVVVDERFRGYRHSLVMAAALIEHLSNGRNICVLIHPLPRTDYRREAAYEEADEATQAAMASQDVKSFSKLIRHWKKLGFEPVGGYGGILSLSVMDYDPTDLYDFLPFSPGSKRTRLQSARARTRDAQIKRHYQMMNEGGGW
jgi:hypothetical protein